MKINVYKRVGGISVTTRCRILKDSVSKYSSALRKLYYVHISISLTCSASASCQHNVHSSGWQCASNML